MKIRFISSGQVAITLDDKEAMLDQEEITLDEPELTQIMIRMQMGKTARWEELNSWADLFGAMEGYCRTVAEGWLALAGDLDDRKKISLALWPDGETPPPVA